MSKIFISYRRHDNTYATHHIAEALSSAFGAENIFVDVDNIPVGVDFRKLLVHASRLKIAPICVSVEKNVSVQIVEEPQDGGQSS